MTTNWVFDLDNTLYPRSAGMVQQGNASILAFLMQHYGVDLAGALEWQRRLCAEHGTTLRGVMVTRGVDPLDFLSFEADLDYSGLVVDLGLRAALQALPGKRVVMTNASAGYGRKVLGLIGMDDLFDGVWGVDSADYVPKPWLESYQRCFAHFGIDPVAAVFADDLAHNLEVPKALGMTTVLVNPLPEGPDAAAAAPTHAHVDHVTGDLAGWLTAHASRSVA